MINANRQLQITTIIYPPNKILAYISIIICPIYVNNICAGKSPKDRRKTMEEKIYGIHCDVSNCAYNRDSNECVAGKIDVCSSCNSPHCSDETACKTFKSK